MFTARNRQNPFAKRRRAQAEAEAAPYDENKSPEHTETPDIATLATGGLVAPEQPEPSVPVVLPNHGGAEAADELSRLGQAIENVEPSPGVTGQAVIAMPISAETQAKIDEIVNRAVPPVELPAEVDENSPNAPLPDAENVEREAPAVVEEPKRGRGRPRPMETIVRDGKVFDLLKAADADEGISKEALAISLDEKEQQVYSSLRQLSKEGRAETRYVKGHGYRWFAITEEN